MIRYRPHRATLSAEAKDEQSFNNIDEMFGYLHDHLNRIAAYIGTNPVSRSDIILDANHNVIVNRQSRPMFIGVYEE